MKNPLALAGIFFPPEPLSILLSLDSLLYIQNRNRILCPFFYKHIKVVHNDSQKQYTYRTHGFHAHCLTQAGGAEPNWDVSYCTHGKTGSNPCPPPKHGFSFWTNQVLSITFDAVSIHLLHHIWIKTALVDAHELILRCVIPVVLIQ